MIETIPTISTTMCAETDSKLKTPQRISLDGKHNSDFGSNGKNISPVATSKSLLEDDEDDDEGNVYPNQDYPLDPESTEDDVRDTEAEPTRGFGFEQSHFTKDFGSFSDPILCSNYVLCNAHVFNGQISDQIEMMTQCRHPMELFSMFHEHSDREGVDSRMHMAYAVPKGCEYCGCESTDRCPDHCQRPRSLFRKKRPPFCPPGQEWDSRTEEEIIKSKPNTGTQRAGSNQKSQEEPRSPFLSFQGFFTKSPKGAEQ